MTATATQFYRQPGTRETVRRYGRIRLVRIGEAYANGKPHSDGCSWQGEQGHLEVTPCNKISQLSRRLDHNGWYMDEIQEDKVIGVITKVRVPRRRARAEGITADGDEGFSRVRFVPGYRTNLDGLCLARKVHDDEMDAGYTADTLAEHYASDCREAWVKGEAESRVEELKTQISELREKVSRLIRALKNTIAAAKALHNDAPCSASEDAPIMVSAVREIITNHLTEIGALRERVTKLVAEPYTILENP